MYKTCMNIYTSNISFSYDPKRHKTPPLRPRIIHIHIVTQYEINIFIKRHGVTIAAFESINFDLIYFYNTDSWLNLVPHDVLHILGASRYTRVLDFVYSILD